MALIKIAYRQIIDATSTGSFEQQVLDASYNEFLMKCQAYNPEGKYKTFTQMKAADGRANSLHYKSGFAIGHFINSLNNKIPGLFDTLGKNLLFETQQFEVIESDITSKTEHKVAITYFTDTLTLFEIIGNYLLLANGNELTEQKKEAVETFLFQLQPHCSIISYQTV